MLMGSLMSSLSIHWGLKFPVFLNFPVYQLNSVCVDRRGYDGTDIYGQTPM